MTNTQLTAARPKTWEEPAANSPEIAADVVFLTALMDDCIQIPGTNFKFGLDGIFGLILVAGDIFTILVGRRLLKEAERLGVSRWTRRRMVANYVIDTLAGMIPIAGDAFDFAFKAHRRNLRLIQEHLDRQSR